LPEEVVKAKEVDWAVEESLDLGANLDFLEPVLETEQDRADHRPATMGLRG
jgi:hypothetical protein